MDKETFKQVIDYLDRNAMITDDQMEEFMTLFNRNQELEIGKVYYFTGRDAGNGACGKLAGFCRKQFVFDDTLFADTISAISEDSLGKIGGREF